MDASVDVLDAVTDTVIPLKQKPSLTALNAFVQVLRLKDAATFEHSSRVYQLTEEWAVYMRRRLQWNELDLEALQMAALLHDVGKVGILDEILLKPGALDASERMLLEQHSEIGYQMIRDFPGIDSISLGIRHHHERWDGGGYPLGLKEKQIPEFAQIIAIVDAFDAMTSDRPYRKGRSEAQALSEIEQEAGRQFGPRFVADFVRFMHARNT